MKEKLDEILRHRELVESLVWKNIKVRYHGSALGYFWSFLSPFLMMGLFTTIFSYFLRIKIEHYPLFLISAMVPWSFFASSLLQGTQSLVSHADFIKKIYCPRAIFPLSIILTNTVILLIGLVAVIPFMLYFKGTISASILLLPVVIVIHFFFILGLSLVFSCLHVFYRDVGHILDFLMMVWFYLTPVIYPLSMVPEKWQMLFNLNPMHHLLSLYRDIFYYGTYPSALAMLASLAFATVTLTVGLNVFKVMEQMVTKEL